MHAKITVHRTTSSFSASSTYRTPAADAENVLEIARRGPRRAPGGLIDGPHESAKVAAALRPASRTTTLMRFPSASNRFIRASDLVPMDTASGRYIQGQGRFEMTHALKALVRKKTLFALVLALTIFGAVDGFVGDAERRTEPAEALYADGAPCQAELVPRPGPTRRRIRLDDHERSRLSGVTVMVNDAAARGTRSR